MIIAPFAVGRGSVARLSWPCVLAAVLLVGCGGAGDEPAGSAPPEGRDPAKSSSEAAFGERVEVEETEAPLWGEGDYGVVLAHGAAYDAASWEEQARRIAEEGMIALAVEDNAPENLLAGMEFLKGGRGAEGVALLGASAGGSDVLRTAGENPGIPDQLILLSATGDVSGLGEEPKLFVASEGEGIAGEVRRMAKEASGDRNEALVLPGDAHAQAIFGTEEGERLMQAILERLQNSG